MKQGELDRKTFVFYPEFSGMKQWASLIVICLVLGLFLLLFNDFLHLTNNQFVETVLTSVGIVSIIISILLFVMIKLYIKNFKYVLTSKRLSVESGIISKKLSNLELWRVIDIELTQSPIQLFFGGCTIRLDTDDLSDPILYIRGLNNKYGRQVFDLINYLVDKATKDRLIIKSKENSDTLLTGAFE